MNNAAKFQSSQRISYINMPRSPKVKQPHCLSCILKSCKNIQDSCSWAPWWFSAITCWSNSQRKKFSSSPLCLLTGGMCESDKNTSLHFIKINKEILTKASMMFCWDLKWLIQSFPKLWSDRRPCSLLPILTLNNQLTCLQHLSFSEKAINQQCNQLLSKKKKKRERSKCA